MRAKSNSHLYLIFPENAFSCVKIKHGVKMNNNRKKTVNLPEGKTSGYE